MNFEFCYNPENFYYALKHLTETIEYIEETKNAISQMSSYVDELRTKGYSLSMYDNCTAYINILNDALSTYKTSLKKLCESICEDDTWFSFSMDYYNGEVSKTDYFYEMACNNICSNEDAESALVEQIVNYESEITRLTNSLSSYDELIALNYKEFYDAAIKSGFDPSKPQSFSNHMSDYVRELYMKVKQSEQDKIDCYNLIASLEAEKADLQNKLSYIRDKIKDDEKEAKRQEAKDAWNDFWDFDGDGVNIFDEFAEDLTNFDYHAAYGSQTMYIDGSFIFYDASTLDFVADHLFAPAVKTTGDIVVGAGQTVIDFSMDYVDDPWGAKLRLAATITNTAIGSVEGAVDYTENILDSLATVISLSEGIDSTSSATIISSDYSSMLFDWLYDTVLADLDDASYTAGKREDGVLYAGAQSVGEYIPSLLIGKGYGSGWQIVSMGLNKMGAGVEEQFHILLEDSEDGVISSTEYSEAVARSMVSASVSVTIFYLAGTDWAETTGSEVYIKSLEPLVSEGFNSILFGDEFDGEQVIIDTIVVFVSEKGSEALEGRLETLTQVEMFDETPSDITMISIDIISEDVAVSDTPTWIIIEGKFAEEEIAVIVADFLEDSDGGE